MFRLHNKKKSYVWIYFKNTLTNIQYFSRLSESIPRNETKRAVQSTEPKTGMIWPGSSSPMTAIQEWAGEEAEVDECGCNGGLSTTGKGVWRDDPGDGKSLKEVARAGLRGEAPTSGGGGRQFDRE